MLAELALRQRPATDAWLERRLVDVARTAARHVPYYRDLLRAEGVPVDEIDSIAALEALFPVSTAARYREAQQRMGPAYLVDERRSLDTLPVEDRSSGSSGIPVSVFKSPGEHRYNAAKTLEHLVRAGLRPWHRVLAVVPPANLTPRDSLLQSLGVFYRRTVSYLQPVEEIVALIARERIDVIYGQTAFIRLIAEAFEHSGRPAPRLALLMLGAERIDAATRRALQTLFRPRRYAEMYGSTETGIIASSHDGGPYRVDYHSNWLALRNGRTGEDGVRHGDALLSSLYLRGQPIVQLDLGDRLAVAPAGRSSLPRHDILRVEGRNNDFLQLPDGGKVAGASFYAALEYLPFVQQFQIVQKRPDACVVRLRLSDRSPEACSRVVAAIERVLQGRLAFEMEYVEHIAMQGNGKHKILLNELGGPGASRSAAVEQSGSDSRPGSTGQETPAMRCRCAG